jgi:hypothetical protein
MKKIIFVLITLSGAFACAQQEDTQAIHPKCLHTTEKTKQVTHYMIPLLSSYNHQICDLMEGTCIYKKNSAQWLHNFGYSDQPLSKARCKNGYGNQHNCLNPCRTVAASMKFHKFGEVLFIQELVGKKCGNLKRDGFEMTHDGFVVVMDTGSPLHFNERGRLDFFWGRCAKRGDGVCLEGAEPISEAVSYSPYCTVWDPDQRNKNPDVRADFIQQVKAEALQRGDTGAADEFDL